MSDLDERARDIVNVLRGTITNLKEGYSFTQSVLDTLSLTETWMEQEIEKQLRAERKAVWEEAANALDELIGKDSGNWNRAIVYAKDQLRQQAAKEGD